jgi:hypothetical protein
MSRGQRIGLLAAIVVIAVVAFVIAKPGSDDNDKSSTQAADKQSAPAGPQTTRIQLKNHRPVGGRKTIKVTSGDRVLIVVRSDKPDTVHLHGYDIEQEITPSKPGRYAFTAKNEGAFDMESHTTEEKIAVVQVQPG